MEFKNKRIVVLAPHTDDGELGCGATIAKALDEGAIVFYIAFSTAEESVPPEFPRNQLEIEVKHATKKLGIDPENLIIFKYSVRKLNFARQEILESLIQLRETLKPDLVFLPSSHDIHQDHETIAKEGIRAFKHSTILGYELIWNNLSFATDCFIEISENQLNRKINALQMYETQWGRPYMKPDFIRSLALVRGTQIGMLFAETFEVIRWIIR